MHKAVKIIIFVFVCLVISAILVLIKESGGGSVMWLGAVAIPLIYRSMFGQSSKREEAPTQEITLKKDHDS